MTMTKTARPGLASLDEIDLSPLNQRRIELVSADVQGDDPWRARKKAEARQLLALEQLAGPSRMRVAGLDLEQDLRAAIRLDAPVAMTPDDDGTLNVVQGAVVGIVWPRVILTMPVPGFALVCLIEPAFGAYYPNVGATRGQRMCLGASLPVGIPVSELVLLAYGLLTMQSVMLDPADSAGVMHVEAARYWAANQHRIPLSGTPFLLPDNSTR